MAHDTVRNERLRTSLQTGFLVLLLAAVAVIAAWGALGPWSLLFGGALIAFLPLSLSRTSLPRRIAGGRLLTVEYAPELVRMAHVLADRAGLKRSHGSTWCPRRSPTRLPSAPETTLRFS